MDLYDKRTLLSVMAIYGKIQLLYISEFILSNKSSKSLLNEVEVMTNLSEQTLQFMMANDNWQDVVLFHLDGTVLLDLQQRILFANDKAIHLLNLPSDCNVGGILFPFDIEPGETQVMTVQGVQDQVSQLEVKSKRVFWEKTPLILVVLQDVTSQWQKTQSLQAENDYLKFLNQTALAVLDPSHFQHNFPHVLQLAQKMLDCDFVCLYLKKSDQTMMQLYHFDRIASLVCKQEIQLNEGVVGKAWASGQTILVESYQQWEGRTVNDNLQLLQAVQAVPLIQSGEVMGVMAFCQIRPHKGFSTKQEKLFEQFIRIMSLALKNAQLFKTIHKQVKRYQQLLHHSPEGFMILDGQTGVILEVNRKFCQYIGYEVSELLHQHWRKLIPLEYHLQYELWFRQAQLARTVIFPYVTAQKDRIYIEQIGSHVYDQHKHFLRINLRDVTEEKQHNKEIHDDYEQAKLIQSSLLPDPLVHEKLKLEVIFEPYQQVSGDYYDYVLDEDNSKVYGFLMDVMGHGMSTALHVAVLRVLFREALEKGQSLTDCLSWINEKCLTYFTEEAYAVALMFCYDYQQMRITLASAGIHHFLAEHPQLPKWVTIEAVPLGMFGNMTYEEKEILVKPGDSFYFLTDGLMDLLDRNEEFPVNSFSEMMDYLRSQVQREDRTDDATALCLQIQNKSK